MGFAGNRMFGFSGKLKYYIVPKEPSTQGQDGNATSAGTFLRLTGEITFKEGFRIDTIQWDINVAGTYDLQLVSSVAASPTILKTLYGQMVTTGLAKYTFPLFPPLYYYPGDVAYISIVTSPAVTMRRFSTNQVSFTSFNYTSIGYDGGSTTTGSIPVKLIGKRWEVKRT